MTEKFADGLRNAAISLYVCMTQADVVVYSGENVKTSCFGVASEDFWLAKKGQPYIMLRSDYDENTMGHEYGHSIFHAVFKEYNIYPDCTEIKDKCDFWLSMYKADDRRMRDAIHGYLLDIIYDYSYLDLNVEDVTAISDVIGLYTNGPISFYNGHHAGYAEKFVHCYGGANHIYEDEWFANICGLLHERNWNALYVIHELFPIAVESCFAFMEKAVERLELEDEDLREYEHEYRHTYDLYNADEEV